MLTCWRKKNFTFPKHGSAKFFYLPISFQIRFTHADLCVNFFIVLFVEVSFDALFRSFLKFFLLYFYFGDFLVSGE